MLCSKNNCRDEYQKKKYSDFMKAFSNVNEKKKQKLCFQFDEKIVNPNRNKIKHHFYFPIDW
jgi:hypothetical protein